MTDEAEHQWSALGAKYRRLIVDTSQSSAFLRDVGLKPLIGKLLGECSASRVLDVGTGDGWLFDVVKVGQAFACDLVRPERVAESVDFRVADASSLPWPDGHFDAVVSNLMLCYTPNIDAPLREMARVARSGGRLVIGLVHPYFYRTATVAPDGSVILDADLSKPFSFEISIGEKVGPFRYYYRPYPDYLNAIIMAGWQIREVCDWFIDDAQYSAAFPTGDRIERSTHVPLFTFFSGDRKKI